MMSQWLEEDDNNLPTLTDEINLSDSSIEPVKYLDHYEHKDGFSKAILVVIREQIYRKNRRISA